jgi:hypothetical protein
LLLLHVLRFLAAGTCEPSLALRTTTSFRVEAQQRSTLYDGRQWLEKARFDSSWTKAFKPIKRKLGTDNYFIRVM